MTGTPPTLSPPRRGFTLLEVMIAVIIMGLGVLGLSALFAGAIRQQQAASRVNLTVGVTNNASEILLRKLGRISGDFQTCNQFMTLMDGQWAPIPADPEEDWALSINGMCDKLYFLADARGDTLVDVPTDFAGNPMPDVTNQGRLIDWTGPPIKRLPRTSVHPASYTIEVEISVAPGAPGPGQPPFRFIERRSDGSQPADPDRVFQNEVVLYRDDATPPLSENTHDHIVLNRKIDPNGPAPDALAFIDSFDFRQGDANNSGVGPLIPPGQNRFIKSISVTDFRTRTDNLISLNDRLFFEEDDRFPRDERPTLGFALMYRRFGDNAQIAYFTYSLQPLSVPDVDLDERSFIPPEVYGDWPTSEPEDLLREVEVFLEYDESLQRYYIIADKTGSPDTDESWVVEPGQWLLMSSRDGVGATGPTNPDPGSDAAVQVLFQRPDPTSPASQVQGVLSGPPRFPGLTSTLPPGSNNTLRIHVWALRPRVTAPERGRDATDADVEWRVRPAAEPVIFTISTP